MRSEFTNSRVRDLKLSANGEKVTLIARAHRLLNHRSGANTRILLRDEGEFAIASLDPATVVASENLTVESLVRVSGTIAPVTATLQDDLALLPAVAIDVTNVTVLSRAKQDLLKEASPRGAPDDLSALTALSAGNLNERLDHRILDARVAETGAIFKLFSGAYALAVEHLTAQSFHWIPTPKLINYKLAGDDDYFSVEYLDGQKAWLTQTGEVHLVMALSADLDRVFDIHTVFRREKEVSTRHLTEFTTLEVGFILRKGWDEVLEFAENLLIFIIKSLQTRDNYKSLLALASKQYPLADKFKLGLDHNGGFVRITFGEAKGILKHQLGLETEFHEDFTREEEAALGRYLASPNSHVGPPTDIFVITHYPKHIRPFNYFVSDDDKSATNSFDIIIRGQEASTGLQPIHSYEELRDLMATRDPPIDPDSPMWRPFVSAHEAGLPPVGGFGMGLNRFVQSVLGLPDIRETTLFPRDASRLEP